MKIAAINYFPYEIPFLNGWRRKGVLIHLKNEKGESSWGDAAPLPGWSQETIEESLFQLNEIKLKVLQTEWQTLEAMKQFDLYPSVQFGLESALLCLLDPLDDPLVYTSALLMGSKEEILGQAKLREKEGFTHAKLKVGHLSFKEAEELIVSLQKRFRLRIDVNRAWKTKEAFSFFSSFALNAFDYIEEPFEDPHDLPLFTHPLAVDESFPKQLSLANLDKLPTLKALIYKPTLQGGLMRCLPLLDWAKNRGIDIVMSSCFESERGIAHVASLAYRLSLKAPVGAGTLHYLKEGYKLQRKGPLLCLNNGVVA